jgi:hypothetical protein
MKIHNIKKFTIQDNHIHSPYTHIQNINENSINQTQHKDKPIHFHFHKHAKHNFHSSGFKARKFTREIQPNKNKNS